MPGDREPPSEELQSYYELKLRNLAKESKKPLSRVLQVMQAVSGNFTIALQVLKSGEDGNHELPSK
jgi:hypothetical protein